MKMKLCAHHTVKALLHVTVENIPGILMKVVLLFLVQFHCFGVICFFLPIFFFFVFFLFFFYFVFGDVALR